MSGTRHCSCILCQFIQVLLRIHTILKTITHTTFNAWLPLHWLGFQGKSKPHKLILGLKKRKKISCIFNNRTGSSNIISPQYFNEMLKRIYISKPLKRITNCYFSWISPISLQQTESLFSFISRFVETKREMWEPLLIWFMRMLQSI